MEEMKTRGRETTENPQMKIPPMEIPLIPVTKEDNQMNKKKIKKLKTKVKGIQSF